MSTTQRPRRGTLAARWGAVPCVAAVLACGAGVRAAWAVRLDFGPEDAEVQPGYTAVTPGTRADAWQPGWVKSAGISSRRARPLAGLTCKPDTPPAGPLFSDFLHGSKEATLRVPVGSTGPYEVLLVTGYADLRTTEIDFDYTFNDGTAGNAYVYPTPGWARAAWYTRRHRVGTPDGVLTLTMTPRAQWSLFALVVIPHPIAAEAQAELASLQRQARLLPDSANYKLQPDPIVPSPGEPTEFTATEREAGAVSFARPWYVPPRANTIPHRAELGKPVRAFATPGETEPLAVSIHPLRDLQALQITCGPLQSKGGRTIPAHAIDVWQVVDVAATAETGVGTSDEVKRIGWRMLPLCVQPVSGPQSVKAGCNARLWLVVRVPPDQASGVYQAQAIVRAGARTVCGVQVGLRVLPYALQRPPNRTVSMYYRQSSKRDREYADLAAHGFNAITLRSYCRYTKAGEPGQVTWDLAPLADDVAQLKRHGMTGTMPWLVGTRLGVWTVSGSRKQFAYTPQKERFVDDFCSQLAAVLAGNKDWPRIALIFNDEPARDWHVALAKTSARIAHKHGLTTFCQANGVTDPEMLNLTDIQLYYPGCVTPIETAKRIHTGGRKFWINTFCLGVPTNLLKEARAWFGLMAWKENADGVSTYSYNAQRATMRNALAPGHCAFLLGDDGRPIPTIAWEAVREGVEDGCYAYVLEQTIAKAANSEKAATRELAASARKVLDSLRNTLIREHKDKSLPVGNLHAFRWQLAWWTLRLKVALGQVPASEIAAAGEVRPSLEGLSLQLAASATSTRGLIGARTVVCGNVRTAPVIDGKLADEAWSGTVPLTLGHAFTDEPVAPERRTLVQVAHDDSHLYVAFRCLDPDLDRMKVLFTEGRDKSVWDEDCVEVFLNPDHHHTLTYQYLVNPAGVVTDVVNRVKQDHLGRWRAQTDKSWNGSMRAATGRETGGWTAELAIAFADLGVARASGSWGFQLAREYGTKGDRTRHRRFYAWTRVHDNFNEPSSLGRLAFASSPLQFEQVLIPDPVTVGENPVSFAVLAGAERNVSAQVQAEARTQDGKLVSTQSMPLELKRGERFRGELSVRLPAADRYAVTLVCRDRDGRALEQVGMPAMTQPPVSLTRDNVVIHDGCLNASMSVAAAGGPGENDLLMELVGSDGVLRLARLPLQAPIQQVDLAVTGLVLPPGDYAVRAQVFAGQRLLARAQEPVFVLPPYIR